MIPAKRLYKRSNSKCPQCGYESFNVKGTDLYACNRPMILADGSMGGSCGWFNKQNDKVEINANTKSTRRKNS